MQSKYLYSKHSKKKQPNNRVCKTITARNVTLEYQNILKH